MYALGTFINNTNERNDHASNVDLGVGMKLVGIVNDGSPLVRKVSLNQKSCVGHCIFLGYICIRNFLCLT